MKAEVSHTPFGGQGGGPYAQKAYLHLKIMLPYTDAEWNIIKYPKEEMYAWLEKAGQEFIEKFGSRPEESHRPTI